jgi:2-oxo-3-hexenedioate decarboxylase
VSARLAGVRVGPAGGDGPLTGWLTDDMVLPPGAPVPQDRLTEPRAAPQIVFVMRERLAGPGLTAAAALGAVGSVLGGIEIRDGRVRDAPAELDAVADGPGAVADDAAGRLVTGPVAVSPSGLDLSLEACLLEVDGEITDSATGAAAHGHPAQALALAANELGRRGLAIEPGWLVLTGGLTSAVPVRRGMSLAAHFTHLGSIFLPGG